MKRWRSWAGMAVLLMGFPALLVADAKPSGGPEARQEKGAKLLAAPAPAVPPARREGQADLVTGTVRRCGAGTLVVETKGGGASSERTFATDSTTHFIDGGKKVESVKPGTPVKVFCVFRNNMDVARAVTFNVDEKAKVPALKPMRFGPDGREKKGIMK